VFVIFCSSIKHPHGSKRILQKSVELRRKDRQLVKTKMKKFGSMKRIEIVHGLERGRKDGAMVKQRFIVQLLVECVTR